MKIFVLIAILIICGCTVSSVHPVAHLSIALERGGAVEMAGYIERFAKMNDMAVKRGGVMKGGRRVLQMVVSIEGCTAITVDNFDKVDVFNIYIFSCNKFNYQQAKASIARDLLDLGGVAE